MNIRDLFNSKKIDFVCACGMMICAIVAACNTDQETESSEPQTTQNKCDTTLVAQKDSVIKTLFSEIDSINQYKTKNTNDSLQNNYDYILRRTINRQLDSLRNDSQIQLRRAQRAATESPSYIKDIPCSKETFYTFFHVPEVKKAHYAFDRNERLIERLKNERRRTPTLATTERNVKQYFDSLTNIEIARRLLQINKLLHEKDSMISEKQR